MTTCRRRGRALITWRATRGPPYRTALLPRRARNTGPRKIKNTSQIKQEGQPQRGCPSCLILFCSVVYPQRAYTQRSDAVHRGAALSAHAGIAQHPHTHDTSAAAALEHVGGSALHMRKPAFSHVSTPLLLLILTAFSAVLYRLFPIAAIALTASVRLIKTTRCALIHALTSHLK